MDILGISFGVDTAACLLRDGRVVGAALEERFTRIKHDRSWPARAIAWCLAEGNTSLAEIDEVAFFWNPALQLDFAHPGRAWRYSHHGDYLHMVPAWLLGGMQGALGGIRSDQTTQTFHVEGRSTPLTVRYVTHHLCHVAAAFFPSPFEEAAVLTVDGYGERASATIGWCDADGYHPCESMAFPQSLGAFYAAITGYLGFRTNSGEGKVMGLAPYGDDRFVPAFREIVGLGKHPDTPFDIDLSWFEYYLDTSRRVTDKFVAAFGPAAPSGTSEHDERQRAVAFAAQAVMEEALLALAARTHELTGKANLVMAGGVAMNSCANGRLERESPFDQIWVQPSAGDGGTSAGAALWSWHIAHGGGNRTEWLADTWGPSFDNDACRAALRKGGWTWTEPDDVAVDTAEALARGELVGWFQGRAELGARALGNRSILADPRKEENKDVLNSRVKFREGFRPFAPSATAEGADSLFEIPPGTSVPFMQKVHPVRPEAKANLGGVTHIDGTARLQTVTREGNAAYHALITRFGEITGVPCVLNTSFNVRGEPMVLTPDDAIRCWATTGLDRLVLGPCVVSKPR
ncbi:MAG: carbamoyl transferase [Proteobacteria bacterium]|nr:carbamoyl transferase [Pseudomonadota bacterium]